MKKIRNLLVLLAILYHFSGYAEDQDLVNNFLHHVDCSPDGIKHFLMNTYNHPEYGKDFLPNDFCHMIQFLEHGQKTECCKSYVKSVFRLFNNKLKSNDYINAYAFNRLLESMPHLLKNHFIAYKKPGILDSLKETIYTTLLHSFKEKFDTFKAQPIIFLDSVSQQIIELINQKKSDETTNEELRKTILVFLEMSLDKLLWLPDDGYNTWEVVKDIAHNLTRLVEHNIIDDPDDLNDMFITLIERYCLFLDIASPDLPTDFYEKIKHDVTSQSILLLELEEQEQYIRSKAEILTQGITFAENLTKQKTSA
jgi:hypothetical protein